MDLVIDAGNTKVKMGVCENDTITSTVTIKYADVAETLKNFCQKNEVDNVLVCSVGPTVAWDRLILCKKMLKLSINTPIGISNPEVISSETGADRLATIGGTALAFPKQKVLIVDSGTCITYDFIDQNGAYTCGNISPGLQLRLNAMHQFTSALPQLKFCEPHGDTSIERYTTATCMTGGAIDGMVGEIEYIISLYREKHGDFKIILTGGDTAHLAKRLKSAIFAKPNYLLESLYVILKHNIKQCESL